MATVVPLRANTNSNPNGGGSSSRRPSLSSFPSNSVHRSASHSTHNDSIPSRQGSRSQHRPQGSVSSTHSSSRQSDGLHLPVRPSREEGDGSPTLGVGIEESTRDMNPAAAVSPARQAALRSRPIKSQYPADSSEKHVEYILVASFDIDRGSIMEHQYPGPVGGDEVMLAELMLPDQTHLRSQDWTIFFLHKDAEAEEEEGGSRRKKRRRRGRRKEELGVDGQAEAGAEVQDDGMSDGEEDLDSDDESDDEPANLDGPPLVYVLNLVNTKQDNTVKRGAIVKAMAICTRHSFLHIYKPLLILALEQYFVSPTLDTLASLYNAVNSMDLSLMPRLSFYEKFILQASDAKDLFIEKFEAVLAQRMAANNGSESGSQRSGSPSLQPYQSRSRFGLPRDTHEFDSVVNYANVPMPVKVPVALSAETVGDFSLIKLITTFSTPHSTSPVPFSPTHPHLTTSGANTHPIIVLLNALLTQKRIIFLGHNLPSSEVAEAVLAACALASGGMLRGFTRHAFPYTDLTKIDDLLKVPGFIAGVTNPAFGHKTEWWDVLCDISTGRMRISNKIEPAPLAEGVAQFQQNAMSPPASSAGSSMSAIAAAGHSLSAGLGGTHAGPMSGDPTGDNAFMTTVLSAINERHGENAIRTKFRLWITKFTRLASAFEESIYGASALYIHDPSQATSPETPFSPSTTSMGSPLESPGLANKTASDLPPEVLGHGYVWSTRAHRDSELAANATRIEGWRNTRSYYNFVQDLAAYYHHRPVKSLDLQHLHDKLAKLRLGADQSANIYLAICAAVQSDTEITQLLATVANGSWDSAGLGQGLFYLALGLMHPREGVREAVAGLLGRVREHEAGRHFWGALGRFSRVAWERVVEKMEGGVLVE